MNKPSIQSAAAPAPIGPYAQARLCGDTLYISGQIPLNAETGEMVSGGLEAETRQVMDHLGAILREAGMDYPNLVKVSIFLMDMADFPEVNRVYGSYFNAPYPARETIQVAGLPLGARLEISAIAVR